MKASCRHWIFVNHVKARAILILETSFERSSFAQFDPRPLLALRSGGIDAKEKQLHSLFTANFDELNRIIRCEVEIQLAQIGTDFQGTHEKTIDRDAQFLRFVLVSFAQPLSQTSLLDLRILRRMRHHHRHLAGVL